MKSPIEYSIVTGKFYRDGAVVGTRKKEGHLQVLYEGKLVLLHRLAWFLVVGVWPEEDIDHKDGDAGNNCWLNIRLATHGENMRNRKLPKNNTTGVKNVTVCPRTGRFVVQVKAGNVWKRARFISLEDAAKCAEDFRNELHKEFARTE